MVNQIEDGAFMIFDPTDEAVTDDETTDGCIHSDFFRPAREMVLTKGVYELKYPSGLFFEENSREKNGAITTAVDVIRMGILADRGMLLQDFAGGMEVNVTDSTPYLFEEGKTSKLFKVSDEVVIFIAQTSKLMTKRVLAEQLQDWFARTLGFWQRFQEPKDGERMAYFKIGIDEFPLTTQGIRNAYDKSGLPNIDLEDEPISGGKTKVLDFPTPSGQGTINQRA